MDAVEKGHKLFMDTSNGVMTRINIQPVVLTDDIKDFSNDNETKESLDMFSEVSKTVQNYQKAVAENFCAVKAIFYDPPNRIAMEARAIQYLQVIRLIDIFFLCSCFISEFSSFFSGSL